MKNPGSEQHIETRHDEYVPWNIMDVFFSYVFIFALTIIFAGAMFYLGLDFNMNYFTIILQILISLSTLAIIYLIVTKKYKVPFYEAFGLSFEKVHAAAGLGVFITAIIILSTTFISYFFSQTTGVEPTNPYKDIPIERFRWLTFLAIFSAPIVEEIFFRGFMQPAISRLAGPFLGIIITALIFGISHTQYLDHTTAIFSVTTIGLILGIAKYRTGSVMPGIFAHFFNNLLAVVFIVS